MSNLMRDQHFQLLEWVLLAFRKSRSDLASRRDDLPRNDAQIQLTQALAFAV
jgi:hypothetical protein